MRPGTMDDSRLEPIETATALYLIAPLFIFFAAFVRIEIAIPSCAAIALQVYEMVRRTDWRRAAGLSRWHSLYLFLVAAAWLCWVYGIGPLQQNGDWYKHYQVLNFLVQHPWPAQIQVEGVGGFTIRYYLGWYLVPALALKLTAAPLQQLALLTWSVLGLFLFLRLLPDLTGTRRIAVALLAFAIFGGADSIGLLLRADHVYNLDLLEWWSGWAQYSSNMTSISWVPQHAISAWLGIALLMRQRTRGSLLPFCALITSAILLWSPFSALGLLPFLCALAFRHGWSKLLLNWRPVASILLLAVPVGIYLTSGTGKIPHGFIGSIPCTLQKPCFTWPQYPYFILIEIATPLLILILRREKEQGFLLAAVITLCLLPLYKLGLLNDLAMRASLPAIALVSILCAKVLVRGFDRYSVAVLVVLLVALPGFYAGLDLPWSARWGPSATETFPEVGFRTSDPFLMQYFAPVPVWILR